MGDNNISSILESMTADQYFEMSEGRKVVTPENLGGLIGYPALFKAMQDDRELRPALSEAASTGRAMADFLALSSEEFLKTYVVADGPVNPKTGKPYGSETQSYLKWRETQDKTPVSTEQFNMFGKMAEAYNSHSFIKTLDNHSRTKNAVVTAEVNGVQCACKVDNLYTAAGSAFAVDVTTTSDLTAFPRSCVGMYYRERLALIHLILSARGIEGVQTRVAAIEKGPMPRCGVFAVRAYDAFLESVSGFLADYSESSKSGKYGTRFEAPSLI